MYDIAIVGSRGFLGGAIVRALRDTVSTVSCITRQTPIVSDGVLQPSVSGVSTIVWAAGGISPLVAFEDPDAVTAELVHFRDTLDVLSEQEHPPRLILLSSGGAVYGSPPEPPFSERNVPRPPNAYGQYKLRQEDVARESALEVTALRVSNAYGPGQQGVRGQGVLGVWMRSALAGSPIRIYGDAGVARDYVFVDDVADAVLKTIGAPHAPDVLNIGSGVPTSLQQLLDALTSVVSDEIEIRVERGEARGIDPDSTWLDVGRAAATIAWAAETPLDVGIGRMWEWVRCL
ncbi:NAD-dependent epimerase/dehydratase family protein [Microbacterium aurantiacum]|uniref:NAD-dependent epimerase/dehydratase family protein n=1 Tax=Microbacterium aurantiacum TaxID=162393 RepID=UPI0034384B37